MSEHQETVFKVMLVPEFEDALLGIARHNGNMIAVYDMNKCIEIMVSEGMKPGCAVKYLTSKIDDDYNEDHCPAFIVKYAPDSMMTRATLLNGNN
jgi:chemotaxis signal transduction protein